MVLILIIVPILIMVLILIMTHRAVIVPIQVTALRIRQHKRIYQHLALNLYGAHIPINVWMLCSTKLVILWPSPSSVKHRTDTYDTATSVAETTNIISHFNLGLLFKQWRGVWSNAPMRISACLKIQLSIVSWIHQEIALKITELNSLTNAKTTANAERMKVNVRVQLSARLAILNVQTSLVLKVSTNLINAISSKIVLEYFPIILLWTISGARMVTRVQGPMKIVHQW